MEKLKQVRLIFDPTEVPNQYATNLTVQHTGHEFIVAFYAVDPPLVVGTDEERTAQLEEIDYVDARCVARVTVAAARMPEFIAVLQNNLERHQHTGGKEGGSEG